MLPGHVVKSMVSDAKGATSPARKWTARVALTLMGAVLLFAAFQFARGFIMIAAAG